jgi:hypothetical protein
MRKRRHIVGITQPKSKPAPDPFRGFKVGDIVRVVTGIGSKVPGTYRVWTISGLYDDSPVITGPYVGVTHPDVPGERYAVISSIERVNAPAPVRREFKRGDRVHVHPDHFEQFAGLRDRSSLYSTLTYEIAGITLSGEPQALVVHNGTRVVRFTVPFRFLIPVPPDAA